MQTPLLQLFVMEGLKPNQMVAFPTAAIGTHSHPANTKHRVLCYCGISEGTYKSCKSKTWFF